MAVGFEQYVDDGIYEAMTGPHGKRWYVRGESMSEVSEALRKAGIWCIGMLFGSRDDCFRHGRPILTISELITELQTFQVSDERHKYFIECP